MAPAVSTPTGAWYLLDKTPSEIRLDIYDQLWPEIDVWLICTSATLALRPKKTSLARCSPTRSILATCKSIREEALPGYCCRARYWVGVSPPGVKGKRPDIQQLRAFGAFKYVRQLDLSVYMRGMQLNIGPNVSAKGDPTYQ